MDLLYLYQAYEALRNDPSKIFLVNQGKYLVKDSDSIGSHMCTPHIIYPGSFNPKHPGHDATMGYAMLYTHAHSGFFELSLECYDKAHMDFRELAFRLYQFTQSTVLVTNSRKMSEKVYFLPESSKRYMLVGGDTYDRMLLYSGAEEIAKTPVSFLVAPRGEVKEYQPQELPGNVHIMSSVSMDISSSEIRKEHPLWSGS